MKPEHGCPQAIPFENNPVRDWSCRAIDVLLGDARRSADTHLIHPYFKGLQGISAYLKDESTHPTGSLKHRLARSLFLYGLCNGWIGPETTLIEASSGSTAVSEAYFAQLLDLPFIAVMPRSTSPKKIAAIEQLGGRCHFVDRAGEVYQVAESIARETGGHYLDQFTNAERATDWRGNNNIAQSIFEQMQYEADPVPEWVIMSAGTGGTSATIGRYIRYNKLATRLCVVDVEGSAFFDAWCTGNRDVTAPGSRIEGIGRPRVEPSFIPTVIDHMIRVPDAASIAAARVLSERLFRRVGGSTGTNFFGLLTIAEAMMRRGREGALVTLLCDSGDRYSDTYYDDAWLVARNIDLAPWRERIERFLDHGQPLTD
ncbi:MAG TPA: PLP-dependent cysteine synthase family protein [Amaricoccus sp.]|uniref:PLP-dependent cysteine synthase family protein n=1 Tax=Amaricoccus sp. TaxID=1872485 RepID=UPI002BE4A3EE|nr:PLP-dependent cysteine synthase family protein [Amaricoccus sp.]HMQ94694.1 PLP-dependent cysteine synthase family protein [Amaricoccus sp.]HMR52384.1 PLP-dependent cysteine synthase family protein [Amaricoccus sp.]HMR59230.1 PLP-dependent cysteine synthase family protein [Amaricoccus sp.]HMT99305.1 PLP-dependent cysteine synthase family protein [Amaricoccus sp.]